MAVIEGEVVQLRRDDHEIEILLQALDAEPSEAFFQSRVLPFNLLKDNLCRIEIYTTVEHTYLFMDIHHIIYDGGSVAILMADLQRCYNGIAIEQELFTAYDYSLYYADWKASETYSASEAYFDRLVAGAESVLYPVSVDTKSDSGSEELMVSIPRGSVTELCRKVGVTENCLFTTALTQVLHRITREEDLLITTISNGRSSAKMAESVGMFVQTLPVVSHRNHQTVFECLTDMQQQLLETISRDKYPFTRLVERHGVK
ncbi:MAG: condensation domain-containing protein, partial [Bacteroides sp.]